LYPSLSGPQWPRHHKCYFLSCLKEALFFSRKCFISILVVVGPSGNVLQEETAGSEGMLVTDFKAEELSVVRDHKMRYFLPNRRPELYEQDRKTKTP
jgi:hypothetical protein